MIPILRQRDPRLRHTRTRTARVSTPPILQLNADMSYIILPAQPVPNQSFIPRIGSPAHSSSTEFTANPNSKHIPFRCRRGAA